MSEKLTETQIEKIISDTVSATKSYNAQQEYYEDDQTYTQRFASIQSEILSKSGIKELDGGSAYELDRRIAAKEISDTIHTQPEFSTLKKLLEIGVLEIDPHGKNYPTLGFNHEKLEYGQMTVLSIEPNGKDYMLKSGSQVYSWDSEFCYPQPSIKDALKIADGTIRTLVSNWKAEEEIANEEKQKSRSKLKM